MNAKEAKAYAKSSTAYPPTTRLKRGPLIVFAVGAFIFFTIFFSTSSVSDLSTKAKDAAQHLSYPHIPLIPGFHNPFSHDAHKPPVQKNSSSGDTSWFTDWKWLNPFSSSITFDESRSVLPPLGERPHIYTYYDAGVKKNKRVAEAERKLLLAWRRAWWAQGFKPLILGRGDAIKNPRYETMQGLELNDALRAETMRWLAWDHMGHGILANWLVLPMAPHDDHDLSHLRRGRYPKLTRYESLGSGLFAGPAEAIKNAVTAVLLLGDKLAEQKTFLEALPDRDAFEVQAKPAGIAFYDNAALQAHYKPVAERIRTDQAAGLTALGQLINAHLHQTFLTSYAGLEVPNPLDEHLVLLTSQPAAVAAALNACPKSPLPVSCPPNLAPKCTPCAPFPISYPATLSNGTDAFVIGAVPHPYTSALLQAGRPELTVAHVRRYTERDAWLARVTDGSLAMGISAYARIVAFKADVASEEGGGAARAVWGSAERDWRWRDLEWRFGFALAPGGGAVGVSTDEKDGKDGKDGKKGEDRGLVGMEKPEMNKSPEVLGPVFKDMGQQPSRRTLVLQWELVENAREVLNKDKFRGKVDMRKVVEAWHLADAEAWRFVRALEARERMERRKWEEEESKFKGTGVELD